MKRVKICFNNKCLLLARNLVVPITKQRFPVCKRFTFSKTCVQLILASYTIKHAPIRFNTVKKLCFSPRPVAGYLWLNQLPSPRNQPSFLSDRKLTKIKQIKKIITKTALTGGVINRGQRMMIHQTACMRESIDQKRQEKKRQCQEICQANQNQRSPARGAE